MGCVLNIQEVGLFICKLSSIFLILFVYSAGPEKALLFGCGFVARDEFIDYIDGLLERIRLITSVEYLLNPL